MNSMREFKPFIKLDPTVKTKRIGDLLDNAPSNLVMDFVKEQLRTQEITLCRYGYKCWLEGKFYILEHSSLFEEYATYKINSTVETRYFGYYDKDTAIYMANKKMGVIYDFSDFTKEKWIEAFKLAGLDPKLIK